jgi:hypothetical protein
MKKIYVFTVILLMCAVTFAQTNKQPLKTTAKPKVEVYYFHYAIRCATCIAVESNSKNALSELYPDKVKTGEYAFKGINLDEASSKVIAKKLKVGGQSLLVVCDNKQLDLTTKVFLYAQDQAKIKAEIKKAVEKVIH